MEMEKQKTSTSSWPAKDFRIETIVYFNLEVTISDN